MEKDKVPNFLLEDRDANYQAPLYVSKVVTKTKLLSKKERLKKLQDAGYNVFAMDAEGIPIDLLTDSGTGSISDKQLSAMMLGDESYAGASSFFKMKNTINELTGLPYVVPCHQGRGAEKTFDEVMIRPLVRKEQERFTNLLKNTTKEQVSQILDGIGNFVPEVYVPGNTHFDTTENLIFYYKATPVDLTIEEAKDSAKIHPFKGNIDLRKLQKFLEDLEKKFGKENVKDHIPYVLLTITCNSGGGQPVSMENIRETSKICKAFNILLYMDVARYAENAYFIWEREESYNKKDIKEIIKEMFSYVDGCLMSSKKDAIVPMGGFIAVRDKELYDNLANANILFEGFKTYGGISGLMMEALAEGLKETADLDYLKDRIALVRYLGEGLKKKSIPIVEPIGGHAVFVDARKFYEGIIPEDQFPAQALTAYLYLESGVRAVEIGNCLKGRDPITGENRKAALDLMRITIPRRRYTKAHMDVVVNALDYLYKNRQKAKGLRILRETEPKIGIRHFTVRFEIAE